MTDYQTIKNKLIPIIKVAGAAILELQKTGFEVNKKGSNDIVTKADILADEILKTQLNTAFPEYGWLSEESVDDPRRLQCKRVWVVDPIDGTREYASLIPEYAISVALIEDGIPIVAAIYNPAADKLFYAEKGHGAELNGQAIQCKPKHNGKLKLLASRSEYKRGEWDRFKTNEVLVVGSIAYKLALVAAGEADATFSLGPKNEWDIAAGVLILQEAGGIVTDKHHQSFKFNSKKVLVDSIVGSSADASNVIFDLIK